MDQRRFILLVTVVIVAILAALWFLGRLDGVVSADPVLTVSTELGATVTTSSETRRDDGTPRHFVAMSGSDSGDCSTPAAPCRTIQYAVDRAGVGDEIRVATGVYTGVNTYGGLRQVLYLTKTLTVRGGYTTTTWRSYDPLSNPTILNAEGDGRVVTVIGDISPILEGLHITGGDASGLGGVPWDLDAGGGIYVISATASIKDSLVFSNVAYLGGGLCLYNSPSQLTDSEVYSNTAISDGGGGGLYLDFSDAVLSRNLVSQNSAYEGAGLFLGNSDATLNDNVISLNRAGYSGGGLAVYQSSAQIRSNTISYNHSQGSGGGFALIDSPVVLSGSMVYSNTATDLGGGGYLSSSDATLSGNTIIDNTSLGNGGGLRLIQSAALFQDNRISYNRADEWGGGLYLTASDAVLTNNVVADNQAGVAGSGLYIGGSAPRFSHNTVARNLGGDGSGVTITDQWGPSSTVLFTNTIVVSHGVGVNIAAGSSATVNGVLWYGNATANVQGEGSIAVTAAVTGNPSFAFDGYHIEPASAALDAGVDIGVYNNMGAAADIDGHHRPYNLAPDLGVDELIAVSSHRDTPSTLVYTDTRGIPLVIDIPAGAVTETLLLLYTPHETATAPAEMSYAGRAFALDGYRDSVKLSGLRFEKPITVTVHYAATDVVGLYEDTLELRYWSDGEWVDAAGTCDPPFDYVRQLDEDWFSLPICHLSRYGTFAYEIFYYAYLPVVMRNPDLPETPEPPEPSPASQRFVRWRSEDGDFDDWERIGVRLTVNGRLELDPGTAADETDPFGPGGYFGRDYYNGGSFKVGEAKGPIVSTTVTLTQAIASWNADTPAGTWIEAQLRAKLGNGWSKWYSMGIWAADDDTLERHSVSGQGDLDGYVAVDTLVVTNDEEPLNAYQIRLLMFSENGVALPSVRNASLAVSEPPAEPGPLEPGVSDRWDRVLSVPQCSQMVYADGGTVWCSPTSTSMVLGYWTQDSGPCEPRLRAAVAGVYDWRYDGHGNWPFNTAYAATHNLEAYVARLESLAQAEEWIAAGVPVVVSLAWGSGELEGAPLLWSNGHLMVLVGFDADGRPVVNDPAFPSDATVRHTYRRDQFETLWLRHTSGTVYLIYPAGWPVPDL